MKNISPRHSFTYLLGLYIVGISATFNACTCIPDDPKPADYRIKSTNDKERLFYSKDKSGYFLYNDNGTLWTVGPLEYFYGDIAFTYNANSVDISGYASIPLNAQGYRAKGNNGGDLTYDSQGRVIKESNLPNSPQDYSINYTWDEKGNLTTIEAVAFGITEFKVTYTYTDIKDVRKDGLDWYFGKRSAYLVKTKKANKDIDFGVETVNWNYVFDTRGRVTGMTISGGRSVATQTYTYEYFN